MYAPIPTLHRFQLCDNRYARACSYKVEWDVVGLEGYISGGSPSDSLLYSGVDVQAVEVSATKNDVGGYFFLSYRRVEILRLQPGDGPRSVRTLKFPNTHY